MWTIRPSSKCRYADTTSPTNGSRTAAGAGANGPMMERPTVLDDNATYAVRLTNSVGRHSQTLTLQQAIGASGPPLTEANATQVPRYGLVLWMDANDLDADGQADNLVADTPIDSWKSKVGDINVSQQQNPLKPTFRQFGNTNLKAVAFDLSDFLLDSATNLPTQQMFVVFNGKLEDSAIMISNNSQSLVKVHGQKIGDGPFHNSGGYVRINGKVGEMHANWVPGIVCLKAGSGGFNGTFSQLGLGGKKYNENRWEGQLGEILFYDRALSNSERDSVERYLADKWSIQLHADTLAAEQAADAAKPPAEPENGLLAYYKFEPVSSNQRLGS